MYDKLGNKTAIFFNRIRVNQEIPEDQFQLKTPPSVEILDYTQTPCRLALLEMSTSPDGIKHIHIREMSRIDILHGCSPWVSGSCCSLGGPSDKQLRFG